MLKKKRTIAILAIFILALVLPVTAYAGGKIADDTPPGSPDQVDGLWEPKTDEEKAIFDDIQLPAPDLIASAQEEKLQYLPITSEQNDQWERAFEQQMMELQRQLPADELAKLDTESLARYIDLASLQKASGVVIPETETQILAHSQVNLGQARHGDFLLGHGSWKPWGYWTHAAVWDAYYGNNKTLHARGYGWGVRHDATDWFKWHYSRVAVMGVRTSTYVRNNAAGYARAQVGESYTLFTSKTNQSRWYCSKLVWAGYYWRSGRSIDLDSNGGYWVTPNNLWYSAWTYVRAIG
jgi:uncharacterized protein YycO